MKKSLNVTVDETILNEAKKLKINCSKLLESALTVEISKQKEKAWKQKNQSAISEFNKGYSNTGKRS